MIGQTDRTFKARRTFTLGENMIKLGVTKADTNLTARLINRGIFPASMLNAANGLSNPWQISSNSTNYFTILMQGADQSRFRASFTFDGLKADMRSQCFAVVISNLLSGIEQLETATGIYTYITMSNPDTFQCCDNGTNVKASCVYAL